MHRNYATPLTIPFSSLEMPHVDFMKGVRPSKLKNEETEIKSSTKDEPNSPNPHLRKRQRKPSDEDSDGSEYTDSVNHDEPIRPSLVKSSLNPQSEDIFRAALNLMVESSVDSLRSHNFLKPLVHGKSIFTHQRFTRTCIEAAVELWLLSFGLHVVQITRHQFIQCFMRIQQLEDPKYDYDFDETILSMLFWLSGITNYLEHDEHVDNEERYGMLSMPEMCILFMWIGPPDASYARTAREAVLRAYNWIHSDRSRIDAYVGIASDETTTMQLQHGLQEFSYRLIEGSATVITLSFRESRDHSSHVRGYGPPQMIPRTVFLIRDLTRTGLSLKLQLI